MIMSNSQDFVEFYAFVTFVKQFVVCTQEFVASKSMLIVSEFAVTFLSIFEA